MSSCRASFSCVESALCGCEGRCSFEIKDVPAGKHKVVAWHPFAAKGKKVEFEVEVADGGTANLKAEIK